MNQGFKDPKKLFINSYKTAVLENNWNEERFDTSYLKSMKPIKNADHQYGTTYEDLCKNSSQNDEQQWKANTVKKRTIKAFPGHQPELNCQDAVMTYESEQRLAYLDPRLRMFPLNFKNILPKP